MNRNISHKQTHYSYYMFPFSQFFTEQFFPTIYQIYQTVLGVETFFSSLFSPAYVFSIF